MPFPLTTLPYGFRRRLREVVTPGEAFAFQIAAPEYDGLQPIISIAYFNPLNYVAMLIDGDNKMLNTKMAQQLRRMGRIDLSNVKIKIQKFTSAKELGGGKLRNFSTRTTIDIGHVSFTNCAFAANTTFEHISAAFCKLRYLGFSNGCQLTQNFPNWIDDVVAANFKYLETLDLNGVSIDTLNISESGLVQCMQLRNKKFHLYISLGGTNDDFEVDRILSALFSEHNFIRSEEPQSGEGFAAVHWFSQNEIQRERYYQLR